MWCPLQPVRVMEQPHLGLTRGPDSSTCQGRSVLLTGVCVRVFVPYMKAVSGELRESWETCTCYCFQDSPEREIGEKAEMWQSKMVLRDINREIGGDSDSKMKSSEEEGCVNRVCLTLCVLACVSLCCVFNGSQQRDQGLTVLWWQLLAAVEKADQFGFSFRRSPAMLPMTLQNIQLLGSTKEAGGHRKKWIVALENEDFKPMNELIFCPLAPSHLQWYNTVLWCICHHGDQLFSKNYHQFLFVIFINSKSGDYKTGSRLNNHGWSQIMI